MRPDKANLELGIQSIIATKAHAVSATAGAKSVFFWVSAQATLKNISDSAIRVFPSYGDAFECEHVNTLMIRPGTPSAPYNQLVGLTLKPGEICSFAIPSQICSVPPTDVQTNSGVIPFAIRYNWYGVRSEFAECRIEVRDE